MEVKRVYVKTRAEFGKQCIFDLYGPNLDVDLSPSPALMHDYIRRTHCHVGVQHSKQFALHQAQTDRKEIKNSGMYHYEGGWPKEVNPKDEEATIRFRRRIEKDDNWAPKLRNLFNMMEHSVLQNGTMDIYEHFFDDMIPKPLVQPLGFRTVNVYADPERPRRPVTCISTSPDGGSRLAISYCFLDYGTTLDYSKRVYIWQVENPTEPYMALDPFTPCVALEFNPRDPSVLASGLMTGQVCSWDLRTAHSPVQSSHLQFSHREFVHSIKWISTKTNTEFFSASTDGRAMWWDTRRLREPIEVLVFDLDYPNEPHMDRAIGVSCLNFGPMVGTKFMFGLENGTVITGSRKMKTNAEKLAVRYETHFGQVYSVDRNVLNPSLFLTVGGYRARVWSEDTREGNIFSTPYLTDYPTAGCWSKSRYSVFYVTTISGRLLVWDALQQLRTPVFTLQLCDEKLTALSPFEEGIFVAFGNSVGSVYLVEPTEFFASFEKKDRTLFSEYLERSSKLTKAVDVRLKEIKLQKTQAESEGATEVSRIKERKVTRRSITKPKDKPRDSKTSKADKEKEKKDKMPKKIRDDFDPDLVAAEAKYYEAVQKGLEAYADETDPTIIPVLQIQVGVKKPEKKARRLSQSQDEDDKKHQHKEHKVRKSMIRRRTRRTIKSSMREPDLMDQAKLSTATESGIMLTKDGTKRRKKHKAKVVSTLPVPCKDVVCKPTVCCRLMRKRKKAKRKTKLNGESGPGEELVTEETRPPARIRYRKRMSMLKRMQSPPMELASEVAQAKKEIKMLTYRGQLKRSLIIPKHKRFGHHNFVYNFTRRVSQAIKRKVKYSFPRDGIKGPKGSEDVLSSSQEEDKERKRKVILQPCTIPRGKTTGQLFSEILGIPTPELTEEKVLGRKLLDRHRTERGRVFPRISEFGQP
ncbi:dynein intermediate chain 3, ciliary-like [Ceratina calcarata]|uniref:Dynein intermediate chain 3, ciliary-like n=1 Tax=Ceratina calcarata TaxID=156304 RepID=A0AAJ7N2X3_9HYME|nr:dynein intermediate chain 3, ciliary-like [Ceratina calcarata]